MMNRILIIGGTGYLGKYLAKASVSQGNPTFVLVRPTKATALDSSKHILLQEFKDSGIHILEGSLDDHNSLVDAFNQVDVVISAVAVPQHLDQLNIIRAIKEVGNIKRFIPSEFGNEVGRVDSAPPPFQRVCDTKKKIRRAIEDAGIPYSFISANSLMAYFVDMLLQPRQEPQPGEVVIYGDGLTKAVMNLEDDIAAFTIMVANDPRTVNKLVICKPVDNIISQSELVSLWEKKTGRTFQRVFVPEAEMVVLSQSLPHPENVRISILHNIFVKGDQTNFELGYGELEASALYPDYKYTTVDQFLDTCFVSPPEIKLTPL